MSDERWRTVPVDDSFVTSPRAWLAGNASAGMPWLLALADDGVIWGKRQADGTLLLSGDVFQDPKKHPAVAVKLDAQTLQEARLFGSDGELLVWRIAGGFAARLIADGRQPPPDALPNEEHLLWHQGAPVEVRPKEGFALLQEGAQGQRHAPPLVPRGRRRPRLVVRHYVDYDTEGQAYIGLSRLVDLVD